MKALKSLMCIPIDDVYMNGGRPGQSGPM